MNLKSGAVLAALLIAFLALQINLPLRSAILIGADEGFEVAKATLCLKGYKLYTDIWNDQPPLHTFLLTEALRHDSSSMLLPRLITAGFTLLLITAIFFLFLRLSNLRIAAIATILLIASPGFLLLGSSCMLEIPALAPTICALCALVFGSRSRQMFTTLVAGMAFAIALEIKLISLVMLPVAVLLIWICCREEILSGQYFARSVLIFAISSAATTILIDLAVSQGAYLAHFHESWVSHFGRTKSFDYGAPDDHQFSWIALLKNWDLSLPALGGIAICARNLTRAPSMAAPISWLAYCLLIFGLHRPWWNYYYVHTTIPLCWCAAIGIDSLWKKVTWPEGRLWCALLALYGLCAGAWIQERLVGEIQSVQNSPQTYASLFLKQIELYKSQARWLYTEEPVYSFHSGIPMPPDLAVLVLKRYWSGEMTNARLAEDLKSFKPELMLLRNDSNPRPFRDFINADYQLIYMDSGNLLYVLKSIVRPEVH
ncbi:MAG TPA: phospholipid carrier-dependent glycosyltransferase [Verrucomicrobiae bacterium]